MIFGYEPGFVTCLLIVISAWIFFTINLVRYNWKNGELKNRIALQIWSLFKVAHIIASQQGYKHYVFLAISLFAILYIVIHNFAFRKPEQ